MILKPHSFSCALILLLVSFALAGCGGAKPLPNSASGSQGTSLSNPVIASNLAAMARQVRAADSAGAAAKLSSRTIHVNDQRQIQVYVYVEQLSASLQKALDVAGATDIQASRPLGLYQAWVTPAALARIATLKSVTRIAPPAYALPRHSGVH